MTANHRPWWRWDVSTRVELVRNSCAELLGTAVLTWLATSTCAQFPGNGSTLQTALTVGTAVTVLIYVTTPSQLRGVGLCSTRVDEDKGVSWDQALVVESFLSCVLVLVILAVTDRRLSCPTESGPLVVGFTVVADFLMGLQYSGCSLNPARSFGPALLSGYYTYQWIYWAGPVLGSVCAAAMWIMVLSPQKLIE